MNENVIEFLKGEKTATVTFCQGRYVGKIKKLAKRFPDECKIIRENKDGSILAHIPVKWIHINNLSRELTEEQRETARRNMLKLHSDH